MARSLAIEVHILRVAEIITELACLRVTCGVSGSIVPLIIHEIVGTHQIHFLGDMADRPLGIEVNLGLALGGTLGGDYDYAVAALGSIDSGQGGILEDVNRLNIRGGDVVYVVGLESVNDIKRVVGLGHRRRSAHTNVDVGSGLTVDCGDLHACNLALEGDSCRGDRHSGKLDT